MIKNLRAAFPFAAVILGGLLIFLLDFYEVANETTREALLLPIAGFKSAYFLWFLLTRLRNTAGEDFYFHHFARFITLSVFLVVLSFALDYYCLFRIDPDAFHSVAARENTGESFFTFFYFSVSTFTTAGFGDIVPNNLMARGFVTMQLCIGWLSTILVIGNVAYLRESAAQDKSRSERK